MSYRSYHSSPIAFGSLQSAGKNGQDEIRHESQGFSSRHTASIDIIDNDSLLNIFYHYRPILFGEGEGEEKDELNHFIGGWGQWNLEGHWWYKLAHVCQRWRNLILRSSSYLGVCLVCTNYELIGDMLAHSPPLPLAIDIRSPNVTTKDEEKLILALKQHDRIRCIRLVIPPLNIQKLAMAFDKEFPILEYLIIPPFGKSTALVLPEAFQAPRLRRIMLFDVAFPIECRLLTSAVGLVTLYLYMAQPGTYFEPNVLIRWLSFMPKLEMLMISFSSSVYGPYLGRQPTHTPVETSITLPNLRLFWFDGDVTYLEEVVCRITTPRLERLHIYLHNERNFSVPCLLDFVDTVKNIRFNTAKLKFTNDHVILTIYLRDAKTHIRINIAGCPFDKQISSMAQIFNTSGKVFSAVEHIILESTPMHILSTEANGIQTDRTEWRKILRSVKSAKTLQVENVLVEEISRCLGSYHGEDPLELLPELRELRVTYSKGSRWNTRYPEAFASFIDTRRNAGCPVTLFSDRPPGLIY